MWITKDKDKTFKLWFNYIPIKDNKDGIWFSNKELPKILDEDYLKNNNRLAYSNTKWENEWPYLLEQI